MYAQETFINVTERHQFGESDIYEINAETTGEAFRLFRREYGRCISKAYVDHVDGAKQIGWVFHKMMRYEDTNEPYLREVWVSLYEEPDTVKRTHHYAPFPA